MARIDGDSAGYCALHNPDGRLLMRVANNWKHLDLLNACTVPCGVVEGAGERSNAGDGGLPEVEGVRGPQRRREAVPPPGRWLRPVPGRAPCVGREANERQGDEAPDG